MKHIGNLTPAPGSTKKKKRIGRGEGSGHGGTSTKGHKGQQSRSGYQQTRGFEGGQMPLNRRLPKFGFNNRFRTEYQIVNVGSLQKLFEENKITDKVNFEILFQLGVINKKLLPLKILGNGSINIPITVEADEFSESAKTKIEQAGGKVVVNG